MISKMQKCQHPQTLLMTQIPNVLRMWHPGSTVFVLTSKRPKLQDLKANQDYMGSLQEANWWSGTSGRKIRWPDNSRSQSSQWGRWISKQSQVCRRGTGVSLSMDTVLSVQNQNFSGDGREFTKVSRAVGRAKSHLHWQFTGTWQVLWDLSWNHCTSTPIDPRRMA